MAHAKVRVDLLLTKENPEWIPEAECLNRPVNRWSFDFSIKADTLFSVPIQWQLPKEEGAYWLTARLTGIKGRPILSQRFVKAVHPPAASAALRQKTFVLLGADNNARDFFKSMQLQTWELSEAKTLIPLLPDKHTVVIWNHALVTEEEKKSVAKLHDFADRGGKVIVLSTPSWNWKELCDVRIVHERPFSRVFLESSHAARNDIAPHWLIRWNGIPGSVAEGSIEGNIKTILWASAPETTVMAHIPTASGKGNILFSQLAFHSHVNKNSAHYDPVAATLLLRLLH